MTRNILFVDDEPQVLTSIRRGLRRWRRQWKTYFATSGQEALEILKTERIDVIVSDMRMPEMNGATFIKKSREIQPSALRIGLSGYSELEHLAEAALDFHQFWSKPCDIDEVASRLERFFASGDALSETSRGRILSLNGVPALLETLEEFRAEIAKVELNFNRIIELILSDPGLYCTLGKLFSTEFSGCPRRIEKQSDLVQAMGLLKKVFSDQEFPHEEERPEALRSRKVFLRMASLAILNGEGENIRDLAKAVGHLSMAGDHLSHLLDLEPGEYSKACSSFLAATWGYPRDVVDTLQQNGEANPQLVEWLKKAEGQT